VSDVAGPGGSLALTLRVALLVAVALLCFAMACAVVRRSLLGVATGFLLGMGAAVLLAVALLSQTGQNASLGHVIAIAAVAVATAATIVAIAVHLAAARAARRSDRLEPW
jgi:NADH:ubiquinone oxidoreductase subunit K